jgi:hypothetical protein
LIEGGSKRIATSREIIKREPKLNESTGNHFGPAPLFVLAKRNPARHFAQMSSFVCSEAGMFGRRVEGLLETMTITDVRKFSPEVAVISVASTEPHGPHLPYGTDTLIGAIAPPESVAATVRS